MEPKDQSQFDDLSFEKQKEVFFKSSYADRGDLLLRSQDPVLLANAMSAEEMYLVTRDMDFDMRSEILKYANLPQLFFMADLDCWKKDHIYAKGFLEWIRCLGEADLEKLGEWLIRMDYEMIITALKKFVQVLKPEWEYAADEILGDKPYFTLDGLYYIQTNEDNLETIKLAIEVMYQYARAEYVNMMEGLLSEMDYEMEEEAFRRRQIRLSERGFPEVDSAVQIYRRLTQEDFKKLPKKKLKSVKKENLSEVPPQYPILASQERLFLDDVLLNLSKEPVETLQSIQEELIWLTNKVLACEGINLASEEKVWHAIEQVRRFVNIGLEILSEEQVERAMMLVKENWLEHLFRCGFTQIMALRDRLEVLIRTYWPNKESQFLDFLGEPYENVCRGLLNRHPVFYDETEKSEIDQSRDFKRCDEILQIAKLLEVFTQFFDLISKQNKNIFSVLGVEAEREEEPTTITKLVGTLLAQFVLTGKISYRDLSRKDLEKFFSLAFETNGNKRALRRNVTSRFLGGLMNGQSDETLESFLYQILARIEEDFSGLSGKKAIDPRYINTVRIK